MHSYPISNFLSRTQEHLYDKPNLIKIEKEIHFAKVTPARLGRIITPLTATADIGLEVLKSLVYIIEYIALSAINLIGAAFSKDCTLKEGLKYLQWSIVAIPGAAITIAFSPINLIFQMGAILIDPSTVNSFYHRKTFSN